MSEKTFRIGALVKLKEEALIKKFYSDQSTEENKVSDNDDKKDI